LFLWHVFSMVCVTPPVEVSPKEARHTSIQTHAFQSKPLAMASAPMSQSTSLVFLISLVIYI
jgi:hypothetical protein